MIGNLDNYEKFSTINYHFFSLKEKHIIKKFIFTNEDITDYKVMDIEYASPILSVDGIELPYLVLERVLALSKTNMPKVKFEAFMYDYYDYFADIEQTIANGIVEWQIHWDEDWLENIGSEKAEKVILQLKKDLPTKIRFKEKHFRETFANLEKALKENYKELKSEIESYDYQERFLQYKDEEEKALAKKGVSFKQTKDYEANKTLQLKIMMALKEKFPDFKNDFETALRKDMVQDYEFYQIVNDLDLNKALSIVKKFYAETKAERLNKFLSFHKTRVENVKKISNLIEEIGIDPEDKYYIQLKIKDNDLKLLLKRSSISLKTPKGLMGDGLLEEYEAVRIEYLIEMFAKYNPRYLKEGEFEDKEIYNSYKTLLEELKEIIESKQTKTLNKLIEDAYRENDKDRFDFLSRFFDVDEFLETEENRKQIPLTPEDFLEEINSIEDMMLFEKIFEKKETIKNNDIEFYLIKAE